MKSILFSVLMICGLYSNTGFAAGTDLNKFFQQLNAHSSWTGAGTSQIYSGPLAGKYTIQVRLTATQNQDLSWNLVSEIAGVPPRPTTSGVTYSVDSAGRLLVTLGSAVNVGEVIALNATEMIVKVVRVDSVTGRTVTNYRDMVLTQSGSLLVNVKNLQDASIFQDYTYELFPEN